MTSVAACIVAYRRDAILEQALKAVTSQSRRPSFVVVVDNAGQESTEALSKQFGASYFRGDEKFGSAGGFALAIEQSIIGGAELIWLLDDDGLPGLKCLEELMKSIDFLHADAVSPLSVSPVDIGKTSNTFWLGLRKTDKISVLKKEEHRRNKVQFYNGVLLRKELVEKVGVPNTSLFMRGDEIDFFRRCKKCKMRMYLCTNAEFSHPSSAGEYQTSRGFLFSANIPEDDKKRYYQFRNRGYLVRTHFLLHYLVYDLIRYPLAFILFRKLDVNGLKAWATTYWGGLRKILKPFNAEK